MLKSYNEIIKEIKCSDLSNDTKNMLEKISYDKFNKTTIFEKYTTNDEIIKQTKELGERIGLIKNGAVNDEFLINNGKISAFNVSEVKKIVNKLYNDKNALSEREKKFVKLIENLNLINSKKEFLYSKELVKMITTEMIKFYKIYNYKNKSFLIENPQKQVVSMR
jgi:hypothetical protein